MHSFKILMPHFMALEPLQVQRAGRQFVGWIRRLPNGPESLLLVIYWVFNSFQPRPKHFYQTVFCGNRATTRLFQLGVKKRTRLENNSVNGQHRMRWPAGAWLVQPLKCLDSAESRSLAALIHLLVLCTRVNEVHLIQRQGPIRLRDWPKKVIKN